MLPNKNLPLIHGSLRYAGIIEPNVYTDQPENRLPVFELFNLTDSPSQTTSMAEKCQKRSQNFHGFT